MGDKPKSSSKAIHKLAQDFRERYGDGGGGDVKYPVYYCHNLLQDARIRLQLAQQLVAIDQCRVDVQPNGIVHDIIDPSLNARMLDEHEIREFLAERLVSPREGYSWDYILCKNAKHLVVYRYAHPHPHADKYRWDATVKQWVLEAFFVEDEQNGPVEAVQDWESDVISWVPTPPGLEGLLFIAQSRGEDLDESRQRDLAADFANSEMDSKRGLFQWVPTPVRCCYDSVTNQGIATFLADIAGLPARPFCAKLYDNIESVFSQMLPLWAKIPFQQDTWQHRAGRIPVRDVLNGDIQVVVKAQRYVLPPHSSYTGRWHTEGFSENIVAAGVYYVDVSDETTGGNLSFRPEETPDAYYYTGRSTTEVFEDADNEDLHDDDEEGSTDWWYHYVRDIEVRTGTAVVFSNKIPHRFRSIKNDTDEPQDRLFINFFIVDADKPLSMTTSSCPSRCMLRHALSSNGVTDLRVQQLLLSFSGGYGCVDPIHHKVVRDRARAAMTSNRPRWAILHYGNAGVVKYHGDSRRPWEGSILGVDRDMYGEYGRDENGDNEHSGCDTSTLGSGM